MVNALGTSLISLGLKGKRIALIGKNSKDWEVSYLSVAFLSLSVFSLPIIYMETVNWFAR